MLEKIFGIRLTDPEDVAEFARLRLKGLSATEAMETTLDTRLDKIVRSFGWPANQPSVGVATLYTGRFGVFKSDYGRIVVHSVHRDDPLVWPTEMCPECQFHPAPDGTLPWELIRKAVKRAVRARKELSKIT